MDGSLQVVEATKDPASHNLWPFEVVFAGVVGFGLAFAAGLVGRLLRRMLEPA